MMNNLEKQHLINREDLDQTLYFQSLLQEAHRLLLLTDSEFEGIQIQSIKILTTLMERYTGGESSSVPVEVAQSLLQSIFYSIGVYLKSLPDIDQNIDLMKQKTLSELYNHGNDIIKIQVDSARQLLMSIQNNSMDTDNYAYNDTIAKGISLFFANYNPEFAAHDTPGSIDYPLSCDKMDLVGIEYIYSYLQKLSWENSFCAYFEASAIRNLLLGYDDHCWDLLLNIFELVLVNSLGSVLGSKNALELNICPSDRQYLNKKLSTLSIDELNIRLQDAAVKLYTELAITDKNLQTHILTTAANLSTRLKNALEHDKLDSIFISFKELQPQPIFQFEDGEQMNDELFCTITNEIRECRFVSDKIAIIQREIHSMTDLIDIFQDDCIFDNEFLDIFKSFEDLELALLLKTLPSDLLESDYQLAEVEKEWQTKLVCYFHEIDLIHRNKIRDLVFL